MSISIQPCSGRHAIKSVVFALEFAAPLDEETLKEIGGLHGEFISELPRKQESRGVVINIDAAVADPSGVIPKAQRLSSVTFDALREDGVQKWALTVAENHATVMCTDYSRWGEVWSRARGYLSRAATLIMKSSKISAVGLQYTDEFACGRMDESFSAPDLFRENSPYLVPNVYGLRDLWHCHHGYIEEIETPRVHKELHNININVEIREGERIAQIVTVHRSLFKDATEDFDALFASDGGALVDHYMDAMHVQNKEILCALLNDQMCKRVELIPDGGK